VGALGDKSTMGELLSHLRLVASCGPLGDRHHNSGFARGWRLAARGVPPRSLGRFRLAVLRLRQVMTLRTDAFKQGCYTWIRG